MKLIDGKFYEGGKEVPIEFGNKEQIRLINQVNQKIEELKADGILVDIEETTVIKVSIDFKCVCGSSLNFGESEFDEIDYSALDYIDYFAGKAKTCHKCKRKYILQESNGDLVIKFNNNSND